jgi:hypothetical protein
MSAQSQPNARTLTLGVTLLVPAFLAGISLLAAYRILFVATAFLVGAILVIVGARLRRHSSKSFLIVAIAEFGLAIVGTFVLVLRREVSWAGPPPLKNLLLASLLIILVGISVLVDGYRWHYRRVAQVAFAMCTLVLLALVVRSALKTSFSFLGPPPDLFVTHYSALVSADSARTGVFHVEEELELDPLSSQRFLPEGRRPRLVRTPRDLTGVRKGVILREVRFMLPETDASGYAVKPAPDAHGPTFSLSFDGPCDVHVRDLASGAFLAADNTMAATRNIYIGHETVGWTLIDPRRGVLFTYVISPFPPLRPVLAYVASLSNVGTALMALLLAVCSTIWLGIAKPSLVECVKRHRLYPPTRRPSTVRRRRVWRGRRPS